MLQMIWITQSCLNFSTPVSNQYLQIFFMFLKETDNLYTFNMAYACYMYLFGFIYRYILIELIKYSIVILVQFALLILMSLCYIKNISVKIVIFCNLLCLFYFIYLEDLLFYACNLVLFHFSVGFFLLFCNGPLICNNTFYLKIYFYLILTFFSFTFL